MEFGVSPSAGKVIEGPLKLRQGNIENALIFFKRGEVKGFKKSEVEIFPINSDSAALQRILSQTHEVIKVVEKFRKIFFIANVKFHIDRVVGLGSFVEIEAIDNKGLISENTLRQQCIDFCKILGLDDTKFIDKSYSDML